jgi:hypothetical protein
MQLGNDSVRGGRDNRECAQALSRRRTPDFPQAGLRQKAPIGQRHRIGLPFFAELFPFVKAVERHKATPPGEGLAECRLGVDGLGLGVDVGEAELDVLRPERHESPAHRVETALRGPRVVADGGRSSVGAAFQFAGMFGVGRSGGIEKASLISLTSEERRARPHMSGKVACRFEAGNPYVGQPHASRCASASLSFPEHPGGT